MTHFLPFFGYFKYIEDIIYQNQISERTFANRRVVGRRASIVTYIWYSLDTLNVCVSHKDVDCPRLVS